MVWADIMTTSPNSREWSLDQLRQRSDANLVTAVARFQEEALEELYRRYASPVSALASHVLNDKTRADDVLQEVFMRLWNQPEAFDPARGSLRTFLLTMTHRRAVDVIRSDTSRRRREDRQVDEAELVVDDLERQVLDLATTEQVKAAFGMLPAAEKSAIEMTYFKGLSYVEAARALKQPEGTVKSRIRSGLRRMKQLLDPSMVDR